MHTAITFLLTALLAAHAALGGNVHCEPCRDSHNMTATCDHAGHHHDHSTGPEGDHPAAPKCEKQCCVYVVSRADICSVIRLFDLALPVLSPQLHNPVASSNACIAEAADVARHSGPALHVWQCVWVI
jgi:hypothetical protein